MKKYILNLGKSVATLILLLFIFISVNYQLIPVFDFEKSVPFAGDSIYNPYEKCDSSSWVRSNFHAHSQRWGGATNGSTALDTVVARYKEFDYGYIGISNYQDKSVELQQNEGYLPIYERGWGYSKFHLLVFGYAPVYWTYPPLYSSLSSKQYLINTSKKENDLVCLNHLSHVRGLTLEDMDYLSGYDLTEVWGGMGDSRQYWDRALSAGHRSFLLANDDSHNADNAAEVSRFVTFVHSSNLAYSTLISSLRKGAAYGVSVPNFGEGDRVQKIAQTRDIARFSHLTLVGDTFEVAFTQKADSILMIGQSGLCRYSFVDTSAVKGVFSSSDTYLRAEAYFSDGVCVALNPLYRYSNDPLIVSNYSSRNSLLSVLSMFGYGLLSLLFLSLIFLLWLPKKRRRTHPRYYSIYRSYERLKK